MHERDLLNRLNNQWEQPSNPGSDKIQVYLAYPNPQGDVTSVMAITMPPAIHDTRLRAVIINPGTNMIHITSEGDHGEDNIDSYNYKHTKVVITQTRNRVINLY